MDSLNPENKKYESFDSIQKIPIQFTGNIHAIQYERYPISLTPIIYQVIINYQKKMATLELLLSTNPDILEENLQPIRQELRKTLNQYVESARAISNPSMAAQQQQFILSRENILEAVAAAQSELAAQQQQPAADAADAMIGSDALRQALIENIRRKSQDGDLPEYKREYYQNQLRDLEERRYKKESQIDLAALRLPQELRGSVQYYIQDRDSFTQFTFDTIFKPIRSACTVASLEAGIQLALLFNEIKDCDQLFYSNDIIRCILSVAALKYMYIKYINRNIREEHLTIDETYYNGELDNLYRKVDLPYDEYHPTLGLSISKVNNQINVFVTKLTLMKERFIFGVFTSNMESISIVYYKNQNDINNIFVIDSHGHNFDPSLGTIIFKLKTIEQLVEYLKLRFPQVQNVPQFNEINYSLFEIINPINTYSEYLQRYIPEYIHTANQNIQTYYNSTFNEPGNTPISKLIVQNFAYNNQNPIPRGNIEDIYIQVSLAKPCVALSKSDFDTYIEQLYRKGYGHQPHNFSGVQGGSLNSKSLTKYNRKKLLLGANHERIEQYLREKGINQNIFFRYLYGIETKTLFRDRKK